MIYLNITSVLRRVDPEQEALYNERAAECVNEIFQYHYKPELGCTLESVAMDGTPRLDVTEGRVVNPRPRHRVLLVPDGGRPTARGTRSSTRPP